MATTAAPNGLRYTDGMDAAEKYAFDLGGYVVLRGVFTPAEVATMNLAVQGWKGPLLMGGSWADIGGFNFTMVFPIVNINYRLQ